MRKQRISTVWLVGVPKEDHNKTIERINYYLEDKTTERVRQILLDKLSTKELDFDYNNPNWAYRQAHNNGYVEALREVLTLLQKANDPNE